MNLHLGELIGDIPYLPLNLLVLVLGLLEGYLVPGLLLALVNESLDCGGDLMVTRISVWVLLINDVKVCA